MHATHPLDRLRTTFFAAAFASVCAVLWLVMFVGMVATALWDTAHEGKSADEQMGEGI